MLNLTYTAGSGLGQRFQILLHQRQETQGKEGMALLWGAGGREGAGKLLITSKHLRGDRCAVSHEVSNGFTTETGLNFMVKGGLRYLGGNW